MKCKKCEKEFKSSQSLGCHTRWCCPKPKNQIKACKQCGKTSIEFKNFALHVRWCGRSATRDHEGNYSRTCSCGTQFITQSRFKKSCGKCPRYATKETREKQRIARKQWLMNNPGKHPWKNKEKSNSVPCEIFKKELMEAGLSFVSELSPVPGRHFSLDVAFPTKRIGVEINGNQHYNRDKTLKKYYQDRHDLIVAQGWQVLELHYSIAFQKEKLTKAIEALRDCIDKVEFEYEFYLPEKKKPKYATKEERFKARQLPKERLEFYKREILEADPMRKGFIERAAKRIKVSGAQVRRIIKTYLPELSCYIRTPKKSFGTP